MKGASGKGGVGTPMGMGGVVQPMTNFGPEFGKQNMTGALGEPQAHRSPSYADVKPVGKVEAPSTLNGAPDGTDGD